MKQEIRRVKAGALGFADLQTSNTVYITGLTPFYSDIKIESNKYGSYECGKILRANQRKGILNMLAEADVQDTRTLKKWLLHKDADDLYELLKQQDGIGSTGAVLCTIAMLNKAPDISAILADSLATNIFEQNTDPQITRHRFDDISTAVPENHAKWLAKEGAAALLKTVKLRNLPPAEKIAEKALAGAVKVGDCLMSRKIYTAESQLLELAKERVEPAALNLSDYVEVNLFDEQRKALDTLLGDHRLALLDGGPGTGKSHLITMLVQCFDEGCCLITSYTNKACINLDERLPNYRCAGVSRVQTINSLAFRCSVNDKFAEAVRKVQCMVVDESSMCSSSCIGDVLYVLEHCAPQCRLILVGDRNQLPPVCAYGLPYKRLLERGVAAVARLNKFRRSNGEGIYNAFKNFSAAGVHSIKATEDVKIFVASNQEQAVYIASRSYGREDAASLGVIAETNAVCTAVNNATIEYLFPNADKASDGSTEKYLLNRVGMRVVGNTNIRDSHGQRLCAKNEICVIEATGPEYTYKSLIDGRTFKVQEKEALSPKNFVPAYCCTVHKFQGSEESRIIYILDNRTNMRGNAFSAQKELKYVGLSRAKRELDILAIGEYPPADQKPRELFVRALDGKTPKMYF